jgi:hypothetical protein
MLWIISAALETRVLLRAELTARGDEADGYPTVRDAIESLPERTPAAIVIELRGQPLAQVERLLDIGVPVFVLAAIADELPERGWAAVLRWPVSMSEIADVVARQ